MTEQQAAEEYLVARYGEIILGTHLNSGADLESDSPDDDAAAWFQPSPLATQEEVS